jgi:hypothetical protein
MTKVLAVLKSVVSLRILVALCLMVVSAAFAQTEPTGEITQADFTGLATQILTYLGYAIVAGLTVLVAVLGARRAWSFMRKFL